MRDGVIEFDVVGTAPLVLLDTYWRWETYRSALPFWEAGTAYNGKRCPGGVRPTHFFLKTGSSLKKIPMPWWVRRQRKLGVARDGEAT